ncbi:hypothetical protein [Undibacterium sp. TS12]|uniref:hypothetical protein n=1 Tax=Undibacterium sp. TS12 TaxID=2908202 RepID=UPI001F4D1460|nr:hypothetical protein [Undibacterium sp. TS12]MCH8619362.1 hypothetical protein [Undibacterium sp. TS12]
MLEIHLTKGINATLPRLRNASIALGLLAIGAGMRLSGLREAKGIAAYFLSAKLLALPFIALPSVSSAYVLAARMGGNGFFVAFLLSASTVLSVLTLPLWLSLVR